MQQHINYNFTLELREVIYYINRGSYSSNDAYVGRQAESHNTNGGSSMSQIKLLHSGGNGVILAAPDNNPASDRTLKLPLMPMER